MCNFKIILLKEHASDISSALCYFIPGLSRLLLPRINSLTLLAIISSLCAAFVHWFRVEFSWVDSAATLTLSFVVFASMMPLSIFTGRILLQTTPPHVQNQIDRFLLFIFRNIIKNFSLKTNFWSINRWWSFRIDQCSLLATRFQYNRRYSWRSSAKGCRWTSRAQKCLS